MRKSFNPKATGVHIEVADFIVDTLKECYSNTGKYPRYITVSPGMYTMLTDFASSPGKTKRHRDTACGCVLRVWKSMPGYTISIPAEGPSKYERRRGEERILRRGIKQRMKAYRDVLGAFDPVPLSAIVGGDSPIKIWRS